MLTDDEQFENNIMPKLQAEHKKAIEQGETNYEFSLEQIREFQKEGGYGIRAWDDDELKKRVSYLVEKRLIEEVSNGRYRITESGKSWRKKAGS